ncbi:MAG: hypothetical protein U0360_05810 [Dehalococcoidia bacterium]
MVEMVETAAILRSATERSLVILDEVGRGTSTQDGLALARAVVEHLHHRPGGSPRTLFATHYQELTSLAAELPRVANRAVAVAEREGEVVFLHRIIEGGADRSTACTWPRSPASRGRSSSAPASCSTGRGNAHRDGPRRRSVAPARGPAAAAGRGPRHARATRHAGRRAGGPRPGRAHSPRGVAAPLHAPAHGARAPRSRGADRG